MTLEDLFRDLEVKFADLIQAAMTPVSRGDDPALLALATAIEPFLTDIPAGKQMDIALIVANDLVARAYDRQDRPVYEDPPEPVVQQTRDRLVDLNTGKVLN